MPLYHLSGWKNGRFVQELCLFDGERSPKLHWSKKKNYHLCLEMNSKPLNLDLVLCFSDYKTHLIIRHIHHITQILWKIYTWITSKCELHPLGNSLSLFCFGFILLLAEQTLPPFHLCGNWTWREVCEHLKNLNQRRSRFHSNWKLLPMTLSILAMFFFASKLFLRESATWWVKKFTKKDTRYI